METGTLSFVYFEINRSGLQCVMVPATKKTIINEKEAEELLNDYKPLFKNIPIILFDNSNINSMYGNEDIIKLILPSDIQEKNKKLFYR